MDTKSLRTSYPAQQTMDNTVRRVDRKHTSNRETFTEFADAVFITVESIIAPLQLYYVLVFLLKCSCFTHSSAAPTGLLVLNSRSYWAGKLVSTGIHHCMAIAT